MRAYEASSFIEATPERVWSVLTDVGGWPGWGFRGGQGSTGALALGGKLTITVAASPAGRSR